MKAKKNAGGIGVTRFKRALSLGRSSLTGLAVLKSAARGSSVSLSEVPRAVRALRHTPDFDGLVAMRLATGSAAVS
jgi:hypothetical protein